MKNNKKFLPFLNLTQLRCFLLFISKTKLMDEIAEEPHYEFSFFETCQLTWKKEQQEELCCCCCCYIGNRNYKEGAALSYESVYPLITILYVVSLWLKRERKFIFSFPHHHPSKRSPQAPFLNRARSEQLFLPPIFKSAASVMSQEPISDIFFILKS